MTRWFVAASLLTLAGCGYVGDPLPPALMMPRPVTDLRVVESGANIVVEFSVPNLTTENLELTSLQSIDLYAGANTNPFRQEAWLAGAKKMGVPSKTPGAVTYEFLANEWIGKEIVIGVRATGPKGKASGWSNFVALSVISPVTRPTALKAEALPQGVKLSWQGAGPRYRVFRILQGAQPMPIGDSDQPTFTDPEATFGSEYRYMVMAMSGDNHQSVMSESETIIPKDTFAPAVPTGLTLVQGVRTIELAWERNTEADLRGYNVYRADANGAMQKIAGPIDSPAFGDGGVQTGRRYRYSLSAIDVSGNESAQSAPVEAEAP